MADAWAYQPTQTTHHYYTTKAASGEPLEATIFVASRGTTFCQP